MPPAFSGTRPRAKAFDYDIVERPEDDVSQLGMDICTCIYTKGYCITRLPLDEQSLAQASYEIAKLDEEGQFFSPAGEVVEGLLGEEGSTRIAEVPMPSSGPRVGDEENILPSIDAHFDIIADSMSKWMPEAFGFEISTRTRGLLHQSGTPREAFPYISQASALQWFQTFTSHRIMCLAFLGPEYGTLELQPWGSDSNFIALDTEPGMCIHLRADLLSHRFRAPEESYTLSCWFLQAQGAAQRQVLKPCFPMPPVARGLDEILSQTPDEDLLADEVPREIQRMLRHRQRTGGKTAVRGASCKMPSDIDFWSLYLSLSDGADCATLIPFRKWDHDEYYDPNPANARFGRIHCKHSGEVEGLDLFDNKKFRISPLEAATLAPEQRHTLEVGYEAMYYAGFKKKDMDKTATGVYAGATWNEWNFVRPIDSVSQGSFGATSNMNAIPANRLSYLLGFNGASMSLDTEGASSLVAICKGNDDICIAKERRTVDQSLCVGVSFLLSPKVLLDVASSGHLSGTGRCLSFNATADGYVVGDAVGGVLLAPLSEVLQTQEYSDEEHPVRGLISASRMGNMGRASSMTAPSAPTDQRLLRTAVEAAGFSVLDVEAVECHGTGQLLWDAVEVASLAKVLRGSKDLEPETLLLSAVKSNVTNSRAASGICGLIKTLSAQSWGAPPPSLHFQVKNPHMDIDLHPIRFTTETAEFWTSSAYCGITSKGFGGSVAHVITWGSVDSSVRSGVADRPEAHAEPRDIDIIFWPAGGGELQDDALPDRAYTIIGSWSGWMEADDMEEEEPGLYGYTVTLGEHCMERFQIRLDGDPRRVLHPTTPQAASHSSVVGPSISAEHLAWCIDGRPQEADVYSSKEADSDGVGRSGVGGKTDAPEASGTNGISHTNGNGNGHASDDHGGPDAGMSTANHGQYRQAMEKMRKEPGDQYRVRLCVNGKWRTVVWEKLVRDVPPDAAKVPQPLVTGRYFLIANWNLWQLVQEMQPHPTINGLFHLEVLLTRPGGEFQICVNRDLDQVLFPSMDGSAGSLAHTVCGPEMAAAVRGANWYLDGKPGDLFRIEFQMAHDNGLIRKAVTFRRTGHRELSDEQVAEANRIRYFIAGSWIQGSTQEMQWNSDGGYFQSLITLGPEGRESFQILMDNDWRLVLHPEQAGSAPSEVMGPSDSDKCEGISWMVGGHDGDTGRFGARYVIRLHINEEEMPVHVEWGRRS